VGTSPVFVLGVGAQKAGTTWLYHYLRELEGADFGFAKEYHLHDCISLPSMQWYRDLLARQVCRELSGQASLSSAISQLAFMGDPQLYYAYFTSLYMSGARLSGDITPAYALLAPEVLAACDASFARLGIRVIVVYLMRDPLMRLVSSLRQYRRIRGLPQQNQEEEAALLSRGWDSLPEGVRRRGAYDRTLAVLQQVFPPDRLHLELYEELFSVKATERLCRAIDAPWRTPDLDRRWNSTGATLSHLSEPLIRELAEPQRKPLEACVEVFGLPRLQANWPQLCALLGYVNP